MATNQIKTAPDVGYALRAEREAQGITQADLAEQADVSVRWLSNFERGKSPRAELIKVIHVARALGLTFELAREEKPKETPGQSSFPDLTKFVIPGATQAAATALATLSGGARQLPTVEFLRTRENLIPKFDPSLIPNVSTSILASLPNAMTTRALERASESELDQSEEDADRGEA